MKLFQFATEDELVNAAIPILQQRGWKIVQGRFNGKEGPPITISELARRLGVPASSISGAVREADCPPFNAPRSPTGRIMHIRPNARFSAWLIERLSKTTKTQDA